MSELRTSAASRSDAERNRKSLLEAAADALAENPGASMAEVARSARLTRATLYRHFSNRQSLLEAGAGPTGRLGRGRGVAGLAG